MQEHEVMARDVMEWNGMECIVTCRFVVFAYFLGWVGTPFFSLCVCVVCGVLCGWATRVLLLAHCEASLRLSSGSSFIGVHCKDSRLFALSQMVSTGTNAILVQLAQTSITYLL